MRTTTPLHSRRRVVTALITLGVAASGFVSPPSASARNDVPVPELQWADCGDGFQCTIAAVPLDYRRPRRETIDISLIRHPAVDQENRIGTLFFAHPLGMVDFVREAPPESFELLAQFDVVGYDGRGVGPTAIECGIAEAMLEPFSSNATRPGAIDEQAMVEAADEYGRRCVEAHGDLLPHMSTATMARDLDLLRAAVGDEQLTYVGISQGTDIGATYASMFPGRVRAMVFDAPVDVAGWRDRPHEIWREQSVAYEQELDRFFTACATHADTCAFGGDDPETAFDTLLTALDASPIESSDPAHPGPVHGDDVRVAAAAMMFDPARWASLAEALAQAENGDGALVQEIADGSPDNELALDVFVANNAVSADYPRRLADNLAEIRHMYGLLDHFWAFNGHIGLVAHRWPVRSHDTFDGDYENPTSAPTILVIGGTHDPATPYQWAERMTEDLGNARLMTYQSDGHGALNDFNPCVVIAAVTYLTDPTALPAEGATCQQEIEPFG